jgi:hypothetical protein
MKRILVGVDASEASVAALQHAADEARRTGATMEVAHKGGRRLEPGTYAIECYVKTEDGVFHTTHGMITGLTVTEESSIVTSTPLGISMGCLPILLI